MKKGAKTESGAWKQLADLFRNCGRSEWMANKTKPWFGICYELRGPDATYRFPARVKALMEKRLSKHPKAGGFGYFWGLNRRGDKARAIFCERMSELSKTKT